MTSFFRFVSVVSTLLLLGTLGLGHFPGLLGAGAETHVLMGLGSAIFTVAVHCLVFAIFTGSGKDTRELVQDLKLDLDYVSKTKAFRRVTFPPALYAIFLLVFTCVLGGAVSSRGGSVLRYLHLALAWGTFFYNLKALRGAARAVAENSQILERVNRAATSAILERPEEAKAIPEMVGVIPAATESLEWGTHVYALGRFLVFMGVNVWLVFLYFRVIVGYFAMPAWPFLLMSLVCWGGGYYLRWRYQPFRPGH